MDSTQLHGADTPGYLVIYKGTALLEIIELPESGRITIGRAHSNRVILPDAKCSREHCELFNRGATWYVRDLNSRNGVFLNSVRIDGDRPVEFGSEVMVGNCSLQLSRQPNPNRVRPERHEPDQESTFEIIERKSGTQFDVPAGMQRIQDRPDRAALLFTIARQMATASTEEAVCRVVLEGLTLATGANLGAVLLVPDGENDPDLEALVPQAVIGDRPVNEYSTFLTRIALDDKDAILAHDIPRHASLASQKSLVELKAQSAICSPIRHGRDVLGVIHLYSQSGQSSMSQLDLEFVLAVGDQLGDQLHSLRQRSQLQTGLDRARRQVSALQGQLAAESELVGSGPKLEELRRTVSRVAPSDALVLIRGESGVGKELVARAVHMNSHRKDGPFVCVNCAALSESLLESELFGHEKGAFTGAVARRAGKFEQAHGGTLFLDEIGEMSPEVQAKFLRVLEGQPFERVGGGEPISVDVRVVTATNRDLEQAVRERQLRRDLFFRLQVLEIRVPALREHAEDISAIANHFLVRFASQTHRRVKGFTPTALQKLQQHSWPGNVRELRNVVERAVILSDHELLLPDDIALTNLNLDAPGTAADESQNLPARGPVSAALPAAPASPEQLWTNLIQQETSLDEMDRLYIEAVLKSTMWNKSRASRMLQIERTTLDRRLKKYGLNRPAGIPADEDGATEVENAV